MQLILGAEPLCLGLPHIIFSSFTHTVPLAAQRPALPAAGRTNSAKRNQIPRLNQAQNAEPTSRPVHALLGALLYTGRGLKIIQRADLLLIIFEVTHSGQPS